MSMCKKCTSAMVGETLAPMRTDVRMMAPVALGTVPQSDEPVRAVAPHLLSRERLLPVLPALEPLLPGGGLPRGATVLVRPAVGGSGAGATALALALVAAATASGSWCGVVGLPGLGYLAAAELGVFLEHLVVLDPPTALPRVLERALAASIDVFDLVLAGAAAGPAAAPRLVARARARGVALVVLEGSRAAAGEQGSWRGPAELVLSVGASGWEGLGRGEGRLGVRRLAVAANGRGAASRPRRTVLVLPAADGAVAPEGST